LGWSPSNPFGPAMSEWLLSYVLCSAAFVAINTVPWKVNLVLEVVGSTK